MKCIICKSNTEYYFYKTYDSKPFYSLMRDIGKIEYYKCTNCGFTISKTHHELTIDRWNKLNIDFHHYFENNKVPINQPPYIELATLIKILSYNDIINIEGALDYGGGYGTLSRILKKYYNINLLVYDPYIQNPRRDIYIAKENLANYKTVLASALFEHLTTRESFDEINNCVAYDGCMIIHTQIRENIPNDPNWFYLDPPVHCAFHTNKSMEILMEQWGYKSSIYCLTGRSWILFKEEFGDIQKISDRINMEFQTEYLIYSKGFVNYWK